jgi:di- and tripeptidase
LKSHPSRRTHRFFDSIGPAGTPRPSDTLEQNNHFQESHLLEIEPVNILQYAHFGYVYCMMMTKSLSGNGDQMLLSGGGDGSIKLWAIDPETSALSMERVKTLSSGDCGVLSMAVRDQFLYCGLTDGEITIWDLDTQTLIRSVRGHEDDVLTITIKDNYIYSGSASGFMRVSLLDSLPAFTDLFLIANAHRKRNGANGSSFLTGGKPTIDSFWPRQQPPSRDARC